jgi:hypothetical protein
VLSTCSFSCPHCALPLFCCLHCHALVGVSFAGCALRPLDIPHYYTTTFLFVPFAAGDASFLFLLLKTKLPFLFLLQAKSFLENKEGGRFQVYSQGKRKKRNLNRTTASHLRFDINFGCFTVRVSCMHHGRPWWWARHRFGRHVVTSCAPSCWVKQQQRQYLIIWLRWGPSPLAKSFEWKIACDTANSKGGTALTTTTEMIIAQPPRRRLPGPLRACYCQIITIIKPQPCQQVNNKQSARRTEARKKGAALLVWYRQLGCCLLAGRADGAPGNIAICPFFALSTCVYPGFKPVYASLSPSRESLAGLRYG